MTLFDRIPDRILFSLSREESDLLSRLSGTADAELIGTLFERLGTNDVAFRKGYNEGFEDGESEGYQNGYDDGMDGL